MRPLLSVTHDFNTFFDSGANQLGGYPAGSSTFAFDPMFVDAAARDFRLRDGSPGIDSGEDSPPGGLSAVDFDGALRRQGGIVDYGAYETAPEPSSGLGALAVGAALAWRRRARSHRR